MLYSSLLGVIRKYWWFIFLILILFSSSFGHFLPPYKCFYHKLTVWRACYNSTWNYTENTRWEQQFLKKIFAIFMNDAWHRQTSFMLLQSFARILYPEVQNFALGNPENLCECVPKYCIPLSGFRATWIEDDKKNIIILEHITPSFVSLYYSKLTEKVTSAQWSHQKWLDFGPAARQSEITQNCTWSQTGNLGLSVKELRNPSQETVGQLCEVSFQPNFKKT